MRQAELNNWSLEPTQIADLCSSINQFFARTGVIPPLGAVQPPVCHGTMHPNKPSQHLNTGETQPLLFPVCIWLNFCSSCELLLTFRADVLQINNPHPAGEIFTQ